MVVLTLVAFALRVFDLGAVSLRWDEGWSIALASLPLLEMLSLTAQDVHPPLYYALLAPWLAAVGVTEFLARFPSAAAASLAVPLAGAAARAWWPRSARRPRHGAMDAWAAGAAAAVYATLAPGLIYYAGVTRMYALVTPALLLGAWGLARLMWPRGPGWPGFAAAALGSAAALYTFYYAGFALAGLYGAALIAAPRRWAQVALAGAAVATAFVPWLAYALPLLSRRMSENTGGFAFSWAPVPGHLMDGLVGATYAFDAPALAIGLPLVILSAGFASALALRRRLPGLWARFASGLLPMAAVLLAAAYGAQAHMFAPRYTVIATVFVALGVGLGSGAIAALSADAFGRLHRRVNGRGRGGVGGAPVAAAAVTVIALAIAATFTSWPSLSTSVYARSAEIHDAWDPTVDWRALADARAADLAVFNILSLAGIYERYRTPDDPPWTYVQLWDPVHEPVPRARQRLARAAGDHERLWLILYKGIYSPTSAELKSWLDETFFPAETRWVEDRLVQSYLLMDPDAGVSPRADFGNGVRLEEAAFTSTVSPGAGLAIHLLWAAAGTPAVDGRVFVHVLDSQGRLVAQHDGYPAFDTRPPTTWQPGERIKDRRGISLPVDATGPWRLRVGVYDPSTGERWLLPDGSDSVTLGLVRPATRGGTR